MISTIELNRSTGGAREEGEGSPGAASETLLQQLRAYLRCYRPRDELFPGRVPGQSLSPTSVQKIYTHSKRQAGVAKTGGIHALRHRFATRTSELAPANRDHLDRYMLALRTYLGHTHLQGTQLSEASDNCVSYTQLTDFLRTVCNQASVGYMLTDEPILTGRLKIAESSIQGGLAVATPA